MDLPGVLIDVADEDRCHRAVWAGRDPADGIPYEHRRELGTPPDLRVDDKAGRIAKAAAAYRVHVEATASDAIDALAAELADPKLPRTAVLCLEADPAECHPNVLAEAPRERQPALQAVDL